MKRVLSTRALEGSALGTWRFQLEQLALDTLHLEGALPAGAASRLRTDRIGIASVRGGGSDVRAVLTMRDLEQMGQAGLSLAERLTSPRILIDLGGRGEPATWEARLTDAARVLHGLVRHGPAVLLDYRDLDTDLLDHEAAGWLLSDLPELGLCWDPSAGWQHPARAHADAPERGIAGLLGRVGALRVHGQGSDGRGAAHPEDLGAPWDTLASVVPRQAPWLLDLSARLGLDGVADAVRFVEHVRQA